MELSGRLAVITGASTGIGLSVAEALGREGCRLAICARTEVDLEQAAERLRTIAPQVLAVPTDVSDEGSVRAFAKRVHSELGTADILVNNAGVGVFGHVLDLTPADYDVTFGVNVRGVFLCTQAFVPAMVEQNDGVVVNVASIAGKNFFPNGSVYAASKHAVMGMSKSMMLDLRKDNVRVITVCPGSVYTPFFEKAGQSPDPETIIDPGDVAELVVKAIQLSDGGTVSEVEIRPVNP
jgi:3-oxoacyl-[acyl-carrier protein] reductase